MNIKISNGVLIAILVSIGLLIFALIRGCKKIRQDKANIDKLMGLTDSSMALSRRAVGEWEIAKKAYKDTLEFERGQRMLAEAQKERTEDDLSKALTENERLIRKYKSRDYTDTTMIQAPREFVDDCKDCFSRLEITDKITLKYKKEVSDWADKYKKETARISGRVTQVEKERDAFRFSVDSINNIQKKAINSIKPRGRLYLSWGVLWSYWPTAAGGGLMYQTPRNMIFGLKGYYGAGKTTIETTINFPLSLKRR